MKSAKTKRNPVPTADDLCEVCEAPYAQTHEVFFGTANRKKSIQHGMQIRLCDTHHKLAHSDKEYQDKLHREYQERFERNCIENWDYEPHEARALFMRDFGRNYLD
jgi:hypothetical protein